MIRKIIAYKFVQAFGVTGLVVLFAADQIRRRRNIKQIKGV